jgi:hypothetical protein
MCRRRGNPRRPSSTRGHASAEFWQIPEEHCPFHQTHGLGMRRLKHQCIIVKTQPTPRFRGHAWKERFEIAQNKLRASLEVPSPELVEGKKVLSMTTCSPRD